MSEKTNAIIKQLHDGVEVVFATRFQDYLNFLASFRQYSFGNTLLIMLQTGGNASYVASYTDWRTKHHRQVKRGSKAIKIIAPHTYTEKVGDDDVQRIGYHVCSVFDYEQTEACPNCDDSTEDIPVLCRTLDNSLSNRDSDLFDVLVDSICPVPVSFEKIKGKANGYYDPENLKIVLNEKIKGTVQSVSTLIHEAGHAWTCCNDDTEKEMDRATKEVVAQSISYIVATYFGIDNSEYTFDYVCSWSKDRSHKELTNSLDVIRKTSNDMIERIEERLLKDVA